MGQWEEIRSALEERLRVIRSRLGRIRADQRGESVPVERDSQEQAIQRENDEVIDALDAAGRREFDEIRAALARIDQGTYGRCAGCGAAIDPRRLRALPTTLRCLACMSG
jgi:RNA polymerase-binding transcription factor